MNLKAFIFTSAFIVPTSSFRFGGQLRRAIVASDEFG
jgi:hypothetical protein